MRALATVIATVVLTLYPCAESVSASSSTPLADGLGHYWYDGAWHNADGSSYYTDGLGHTWQSGIWYNADGTPYREPQTWESWARTAGWPEALLPDLGRVMWCESHYAPTARNGQYLGLMQLSPMWFAYAGEDLSLWTDPVVNLRTAYAVYLYDIVRGRPGFTQWQCKP